MNNAVLGSLSSTQTVIQANGTATAQFTAGLVTGTGLRSASAETATDGIIPISLEMTEGGGNVVVLQEPPRASRGDDFISINTVIIGCTAGAAAGAALGQFLRRGLSQYLI